MTVGVPKRTFIGTQGILTFRGETTMKMLIIALLFFIIASTPALAYTELSFDFKDMFEEHGSIMLIIEPASGRIVFANKAAEAFYGYQNIEAMTIQQINTLTPEEVERERMAAVREERNFFVFQHRLASGDIKTVDVYSYPFLIDEQTVLFSIIHDKTEKLLLAEREQMRNRNNFMLLMVLVVLLILFAIYLFTSLERNKVEKLKLLESERKTKTLISNIRGMVYRCKYDEYWTMEYVSDGAFEVTGYLPEELVNNAVIDYNSVIVEDYREILRVKWETLIKRNKEVFEHEYTIVTKKGSEKWVLERGQIIYDSNGKVEALEGIITDVSEIKASQKEADEYRRKLHATIFSAGDGIIATDTDLKIELMNPEAERITGWKQETAIGQNFETVFQVVNEVTRERQINPAKQALFEQAVVEIANKSLLISRGGREYPIEDTASPIWDANGDIIGCIVIFRDNTEKYVKNKELEYVSFHDYLTGLYNRRFFEEELKRLDNNRNLPISVILLDVNGLKITNDAFGHDVGDELIKVVATVLKTVCRQNDIVARYGGDEFIILLLNSDEEVVEYIADRITSSLKQQKIMDMDVTVSMGWDTKRSIDEKIDDKIRKAENRMYQQKINEHSANRDLLLRSVLEKFRLKGQVNCDDLVNELKLNSTSMPDSDVIDIITKKELKLEGNSEEAGAKA